MGTRLVIDDGVGVGVGVGWCGYLAAAGLGAVF